MAALPDRAPGLARSPLPPMTSPVLVDDDGRAWVPAAFRAGHYALLPVCEGLALGWTPSAELGRVMLVLVGGNMAEPGDESVVTLLTRTGLRNLIADLQSIDDQLEDRA
jgi:hypothetical protein